MWIHLFSHHFCTYSTLSWRVLKGWHCYWVYLHMLIFWFRLLFVFRVELRIEWLEIIKENLAINSPSNKNIIIRRVELKCDNLKWTDQLQDRVNRMNSFKIPKQYRIIITFSTRSYSIIKRKVFSERLSYNVSSFRWRQRGLELNTVDFLVFSLKWLERL